MLRRMKKKPETHRRRNGERAGKNSVNIKLANDKEEEGTVVFLDNVFTPGRRVACSLGERVVIEYRRL